MGFDHMVAIIIVNWNAWNLIEKCLNALSQQTYKDYCVFVIDNASDQKVPDKIERKYPDVKLIINDSNIGFARANNQALKLSLNFEFVFFCNPDAYPEPDCLKKLVEAANRYKHFSVFASRLVRDENRLISDGDGDNYHISGFAWRANQGENVQPLSKPKEIFSACAAAAMFRTNDLHEAGGFDPDYFCYFEDVDLGFRLRLRGFRCLLVPDAITSHVSSGVSGDPKSDFILYHAHRNMIWTYMKNMPGLLFWVFLPLHIMLNICCLAWYIIKGKGGILLKSQMDAFELTQKMLKKRRSIQEARATTLKEVLHTMSKETIPTTLKKAIRYKMSKR